MALTKQVVVDKIEVLEDGQIQVRTATRVMEDGVKLSETYHRKVLAPGDSLVGADPKVAAQAQAAWTPAVIAAFQVARAA